MISDVAEIVIGIALLTSILNLATLILVTIIYLRQKQ